MLMLQQSTETPGHETYWGSKPVGMRARHDESKRFTWFAFERQFMPDNRIRRRLTSRKLGCIECKAAFRVSGEKTFMPN